MKNNLFTLLLLILSFIFSTAARGDIFRGGVSVGGGFLPAYCDELSVKLAESVEQNTGREVNVTDLRSNLIVIASAYQHLIHISKNKTYLLELNNILSKNLPELLNDNTLAVCNDPELIKTFELTDSYIAQVNSALNYLILNLKN